MCIYVLGYLCTVTNITIVTTVTTVTIVTTVMTVTTGITVTCVTTAQAPEKFLAALAVQC